MPPILRPLDPKAGVYVKASPTEALDDIAAALPWYLLPVVDLDSEVVVTILAGGWWRCLAKRHLTTLFYELLIAAGFWVVAEGQPYDTGHFTIPGLGKGGGKP